MMRFENLLVAIAPQSSGVLSHDRASFLSCPAVQVALDLAAVSGANVTFCAVIPPENCDRAGSTTSELVRESSTADITRSELLALQELTERKGIPARCLIRSGNFHDEMIAESSEDAYDLLLFDYAVGESCTPSQVIGRLISSTSCSVWLAHRTSHPAIHNMAVVNAGHAHRILSLAVTMARLLNSRLHVMQSIDANISTCSSPGPFTDPDRQLDRAMTREKADSDLRDQLAWTDYRALPFGTKLEIIEADCDEFLRNYVVENQVDLLVIERMHMVQSVGTEQSLRSVWNQIVGICSVLAVKSDRADSRA